MLRLSELTITEHNFDKDKVIFTQNAARGGVVPTVSWSSSGDTHTATFVYSKDGDYTFDVTMTDLATNASAAANYGKLQPNQSTPIKNGDVIRLANSDFQVSIV